jgi:hypothetical protein
MYTIAVQIDRDKKNERGEKREEDRGREIYI